MTKHTALDSRDSVSGLSEWQRLYSSSSHNTHNTTDKTWIEYDEDCNRLRSDHCINSLEPKIGVPDELGVTTLDHTTINSWFETEQNHEDRIAKMQIPDEDHDLLGMPQYFGQHFISPETSLSPSYSSHRGGGDRISMHLINDDEKKADDVLKELEKMLNENDLEMDGELVQDALERSRTTDQTMAPLLGVERKEKCWNNMNLHSFSSFPSGKNEDEIVQRSGSNSYLDYMHSRKAATYISCNLYKRIGKNYLVIWHQYSLQISLRRETILKNWIKKNMSLLLTSWKYETRVERIRCNKLLLKNELLILGRKFGCWYEVVKIQSAQISVRFCR